MARRLLILSASIGAGHVKAGEALCKAYTERFGGEAFHMDFFHYSTPKFSRFVEHAYYLVTKHTPSVYRLLYNIEDRPNSPVKKMEVIIGLKKYRKMIAEFNPDAIISTHFLPAAVVSHMYRRFPIPNGVILTDYVSHPMWIYPNNQRFFVAHSRMVNQLTQLGVNRSKIRDTGIPVRPCFGQPFDRKKLQEKLHINPEIPVILLMSGGNAIGPLTQIMETLGGISEEFQVVAIAGRNKQIYQELESVAKSADLNAKVLGYTDNIHEWMAVADLLISKAGGLTVTEALTIGLPMLIIRPTPGQEDGNTEFLTQAGAGMHLKSVSALGEAVSDLLRNPSRISSMRIAAKNYARPDAAFQILSEMEKLVELE